MNWQLAGSQASISQDQPTQQWHTACTSYMDMGTLLSPYLKCGLWGNTLEKGILFPHISWHINQPKLKKLRKYN